MGVIHRFARNIKMLLGILGGITVLEKNHVRFGLKLVENAEGFLWFRLEKSLFQLQNDIFLYGAYIPPNNTPLPLLQKRAILEN